jgi:hypothetical protein
MIAQRSQIRPRIIENATAVSCAKSVAAMRAKTSVAKPLKIITIARLAPTAVLIIYANQQKLAPISTAERIMISKDKLNLLNITPTEA